MNPQNRRRRRRRHGRLGTITIGRKLGLLCLAFALPVVTLLGFFVSDRQQIRETAQSQLRSARSLEPLRLLRRDLTHARLLVLGSTGRDSVPAEELEAAEARINQDFRKLLDASDPARPADLRRLFDRWKTLAAQPLHPSLTDSGYQALLNELAIYTQKIGLESPVAQDQEPTTFWLGQSLVRTLPALDALRMRLVDVADVTARRGSVEAHERVQLQVLATQLDTLLDDTADLYLRAGEERRLGPALQALLAADRAILDRVKFDLADLGSPYLAAPDLRADAARADAASLELWVLSSRIFQEHLKERIAKLDRDNTTAVATTLVAVGISVFLATMLIQSIRRPLQQAAAVARRMSEGDIDAQLPAHGGDEIGVMLQAMRDVLHNLQAQAFRDPLTGLPNRRAFAERVDKALAARRGSQGVALLFVDIDHFKQINDVMGHACGDELLVGLAARLRASTQPADIVARFGGDEFTVLLEHLPSIEDAVRGAERIANSLEDAFWVAGRQLYVTASVGIGYTDDPATMPGDLLREADVALYQSKADGRDRHTIFLQTMAEGATELLHLDSDLRRAVERHDFHLEFQPIVALDTGEVVGAEALIRWDRAGHGVVSPDGFIPVAEANGLIRPIGLWALREACTWAIDRNLMSDGPPLFVSVNLSSRQMHEHDLVDLVALTLAETGLAPSQLRLEITETAVMQDEVAAKAMLTSLRDLGVSLLIDDFGTGYSTLRSLQHLPVDGIKIDMSFIEGVQHDRTKQVLVKSIMEMARTLDLSVVVEGVEDVAQHSFLTLAGCQYAQGHLYSTPMAAGLFDIWLDSREQGKVS